jgi:FtsP/CotA-like multicopper oxidase with cupredoxin domain
MMHKETVSKPKSKSGFLESFLNFFIQLLQKIFKIFPTKPGPDTIPTPTGMIMPSASPSGNLISVADLKYVPNGEPTDSYNWVASASGEQFTINGTVPGPQLLVHQGDHVHVNVLNTLPVSLSIHWHGLAVPNSADGVPGATQDAIKPGQSYTYDFVANEAGTFFYHTHQDTLNDMPKGLFGPLIILPPKETFPTDLDYTVFYRNITASDAGAMTTFPAAPGQTVRLRIVDARNGDFSGAPVTAALIGAPFKVVGIDGRAINAPQTISNEIIPMDMAQRYDLEFTMPPSGSVQLVENTQDQAGNNQMWTFGSGSVTNQPASINSLPTFNFTNYGLPTSDDALPPNGKFDQNFIMNIGENLSINGQLFPNVPDLVVHQGNYIHVQMVNNSNMWHAMHLHGGYFTVMDLDGIPVKGSPIHMDTLLLAPFQSANIAFHATDAGIWMFHCHILPHAAGGLMMMVRYDNVYTPYSMAPGSGNIPE